MRISCESIGCRLNQSEMASLAARFHAAGGEVVVHPAAADVIVLNTCAVTREADRDSRSAARRLHVLAPQAQLILTGCWATLAASEAGTLPGVARVVENARKESLPELLGLKPNPGLPALMPHAPAARADLAPPRRRTRAFIKVQDGCDNHCTFCITRLARGASRSRAIPDILREARALQVEGIQEVVLTGAQLGAYGRDLSPRCSLQDLLRALLDQTHMPRIRLSSLEPWGVRESFFDLWRDSRLCPHLHLPLQSGDADTLRRMARRTTPEAYADLVNAARRAVPEMAITTDVIIGFPGETAAEFEHGLRFIERMQFAGLHAFHFSPRPGTPAAHLPDRPPVPEVRTRMAALQEVARASAAAYRRRQVGQTVPVLWERDAHLTPAGAEWHGLTPNFQRVRSAARPGLANRILPTLLTALEGETFVGLPADQD